MNLRDYRSPEKAVLLGSFLLNILLWILVLIAFPKSSPNAILHYTAGIGIDFIGQGWQIITIPSIGALLIAVNVILARYLQRVSTIAFWILWVSMPLLQLLLIATYGILLTLNR